MRKEAKRKIGKKRECEKKEIMKSINQESEGERDQ
jgi:hypothetical protein